MIGPGFWWWLTCLPEAWRFRRAAARVEETQTRYLRQLIRSNYDCAYLRHHGLPPEAGVEEFRARLPLVDYPELQPWLERVADGEKRVLTREKVLLFEPTSGTTAEKLIPYTATLRTEFQRGVAAWIADLYWHRPRLWKGKAYWSITPPPQRPRRTRGGLAIGFEDDAQILSRVSTWLVRSMLAVPKPCDLDQTLSQLLRCPDLRLISCWSPGLLLALLERLEQKGPSLAGQPELNARLRSGLRGLWPQLDCISCWADGPSAGLATQLRSRFPQAFIQPKGLLATEGFVSLPRVGVSGAVLALRCHFFEFIDDAGQVWLAHQLREGQQYEIVLTTGGGLYRYKLGDKVQLVGHWQAAPRLRFLGRGGGVSDHFGEKLSPEAITPWLPSDFGPCFVAFEKGGYVLYASDPQPILQQAEQHLQNYHHYRLCRQLGQLRPLAGFRIEGPGWEQFYRRFPDRRSGDIKTQPLRLETDWSEWFQGVFVQADENP